jgi:glycosyltransferase involved in cell wall biosynthesis
LLPSPDIAPDARQRMPKVCIVGPLPPPPGGMANQCEQLVRLLRAEGVDVQLVRTNAPYWPRWSGRLPVLRAGFRLLPYLWTLWRAAGRAQVMHVLANSGLAWHLCAAPALWFGKLRGTPVIVNYRGGEADAFFARAPRHVLQSLRHAALRVTPSAFLQRVFAKHGLDAQIIPNIVDLSRFTPVPVRDFGDSPHLLIARHLEPIYDVATAVRAFARVRLHFRGARLTVAGAGPELGRLRELVASLGLTEAVEFPGRIDNAAMPALYAQADCALNTSRVDNMPISVLEALASGVVLVSTAAGGIPDIVTDGVSGLLAPVGDDEALARSVCRVLGDPVLAARLRQSGRAAAAAYAWNQVRPLWLAAYRQVASASSRPLQIERA